MIFRQPDAILAGLKTETRRVVKPGQFHFDDLVDYYVEGDESDPVFYPEGIYTGQQTDPETWECEDCGTYTDVRALYIVGRDYAVVPKRGKPGLWWRDKDWSGYGPTWRHMSHDGPIWRPEQARSPEQLEQDGWKPLRIRIKSIRRERLQDITEEGAKAEGVESVEAYKALWQSINGKTKGARWDDNPHVFVIQFEIVR